MIPNDKIAKIVALGKKRYVVRYGVLGWGLPTAALFSAWTYYTKEDAHAFEFVLPFILFPIGGIAWGWFMWAFLKKKHEAAHAGSTK